MLNPNNLEVGTTFEYRGLRCRITEAYTINWKGGGRSHEYALDTDQGVKYLEIEIKSRQYIYSMWTKIGSDDNLVRTAYDSEAIILNGNEYLTTVSYQNNTYQYKEIFDGDCEGEHMQCLSYESTDGQLLSVEFWQAETDCSVGEVISSTEIVGTNASSSNSSDDDDDDDYGLKDQLMGWGSIIALGAILMIAMAFLKPSEKKKKDGYYSGNGTTHRSGSSYRRRSSGFGK